MRKRAVEPSLETLKQGRQAMAKRTAIEAMSLNQSSYPALRQLGRFKAKTAKNLSN